VSGDNVVGNSYLGTAGSYVYGAPTSYVVGGTALRNSSYVVGGSYPVVTRGSVLRSSQVYAPSTYYPTSTRVISNTTEVAGTGNTGNNTTATNGNATATTTAQ
jgi:hypothetical protein